MKRNLPPPKRPRIQAPPHRAAHPLIPSRKASGTSSNTAFELRGFNRPACSAGGTFRLHPVQSWADLRPSVYEPIAQSRHHRHGSHVAYRKRSFNVLGEALIGGVSGIDRISLVRCDAVRLPDRRRSEKLRAGEMVSRAQGRPGGRIASRNSRWLRQRWRCRIPDWRRR